MIARITAALLVLPAMVAADSKRIVVRGTVVREGTPTPIAGASVLTDRGAIAVTDVDGYFAIEVGPEDRELTIVATGFGTKTVKIIPGANRIDLAASGGGSEVIEVSGKAPEETKPLSYQLTVDEIRSIPGAGNDILRAATVLPGVARIPFSFGGLVLRGTSPRDTAVYLDGIEVPIAFHFGGITSFYPSGMLSDLTVTAGGYDSSYGRAAGGLVTLTTREPRTDRWRMGGSIGLFDSNVQAEGPWKQGGVLIGLRRSYLDRIVDPFIEEDAPLPSYWDFQIRTSWGDTRKRGRINPMIFSSIDRVASNDIALTSLFVRIAAPYKLQRGPTTLQITPWFGTNRLTFTDKGGEFEGDVEESFSRPFYPGGVRSELLRDYTWGHLRGGLELESGYLSKTQINVGGEDEFGGDATLSWTDVALWGETRWKLDGERFAIKPGVRLEVYGLTGELVVDPRLNIHQKLTPNITLRQAIGRYHQPPTPGDVDPTSGNPALDSSVTDQVSLGVDTILPREIFASFTGFFNYGTGIGVKARDPRPGSDAPEPNLGGLGPTFELLLEKQLGFAVYREGIGRARSYGLEVLMKRNVGRWFTLLSYTLAKSDRTDDPRVLLGWRAFELDQRHNLQLAASVQLTKWRLGARLQVVSGNPYTEETIDLATQEFRSGVPFGSRLPVFLSIDLRADRRWHRCWGDIVFYIDIQNAANRRNIEGRELGFNEFTGEPEQQDLRGLPIIPFIGVEFRPLI
ncbi:MAG: TonB-dependent receptor plug domain-containing protein [Deltaproteobacteria bacterium]|nr:TonB-dependent receptor plug domain-containing protein [Deltaproteobacteria bacterium]